MKILHVIANVAPRYGGPSQACLEMAEAVAQRGHEVHIATTNQDGDGELAVPLDRPVARNGVILHYFALQHPRFFSVSLPLARYLSAHIAEFDLVHIHSLYLFHGMVAGHLCRQRRIPYLVRPHGTLDPFLWKRHRGRKWIFETLAENRNLRGAAAIHFTSEEERRLASPRVFGRPSFVIPHGIRWEDYAELPTRGAFRSRFPSLEGKKIILFLGRINFKKGLDLLAPAFGQVLQRFPDARLVIAGPDNDGYGKRLRQWLESSGGLPATLFTGMLSGRDKIAALRDADVFVLPSYTENFGITVVEAMASGVPVLISDQVHIHSEIVKAGAGTAVPCDVSKLAAQMIRFLEDDALRQAMGKAAREWVKSHYPWPKVAQELEAMYKSVRDQGEHA